MPCPGTVFLTPSHQAMCLAQTVDTLITDPGISYINPWLSSARTWRSGATVSGISALFGWSVKRKTLRSVEDSYLAPPGGFLWHCIKLMLALMLRLLALASGVRGWCGVGLIAERDLPSFGLQEPISGKAPRPSVGLTQGLPQTGSHLTAFGQGKAPTQQDQDIPGHLIVHCLPGEDGRRSLQLPWFFYSPSRQGWSPKVNRHPLPSFLSEFLSELQAGRREPLSLLSL